MGTTTLTIRKTAAGVIASAANLRDPLVMMLFLSRATGERATQRTRSPVWDYCLTMASIFVFASSSSAWLFELSTTAFWSIGRSASSTICRH